MTKKMVYFDYNVFVDYIKNDLIKQKINHLKREFEYVYSPAYLEEVANIREEEEQEQVENHIDCISELFNDTEFLPTVDRGIVKVKEKPLECYKRVKDGIEDTKVAEELNNHFLLQKSLFNTIRNELNVRTVQINNIQPELLFFDEKIRATMEFLPEYKDYYLVGHEREKIWQSLKNRFNLMQRQVSQLFDLLEAIGYYPEKEKKGTEGQVPCPIKILGGMGTVNLSPCPSMVEGW